MYGENLLQRLSNMENTILNKILHRKSSKDLFENYVDILEKKRNVLLEKLDKNKHIK